MIRVVRNGPFVAARIYLAHTTHDPETGDPMERSPHLAGQIGLDHVDWREVWIAVEYCESSPEQQAALVNPPLSDRTPRNGRAAAYKTAPMAKWRRERAYRIAEVHYEAELSWLSWARRNAPEHPEYNYKRAIDRNAMPVPRFA